MNAYPSFTLRYNTCVRQTSHVTHPFACVPEKTHPDILAENVRRRKRKRALHYQIAPTKTLGGWSDRESSRSELLYIYPVRILRETFVLQHGGNFSIYF